MRRPIELARRARLQRPPFHEWIAPTAQRRNVDVDPVVPPVDGFRIKREERVLLWRKRGRKQARIFALENMLVVQDEWFVQLDEFFNTNQVAFRSGKRRLLHAQCDGHAVDSRNNGLLPGN